MLLEKTQEGEKEEETRGKKIGRGRRNNQMDERTLKQDEIEKEMLFSSERNKRERETREKKRKEEKIWIPSEMNLRLIPFALSAHIIYSNAKKCATFSSFLLLLSPRFFLL